MSGQLAEGFLMGAQQGYPRAFDRGAEGTRPGNSSVRVSVTGTGSSTRDQADLFTVRSAVAESGNTLAASISISATNYTNAQVAEYLRSNPMELRSFNIVSMAAAALATLIIKPVRETPFGTSATDQIAATDFLSSADYQTDRIGIPVSLVCDGYSWPRLINDGQSTAVTYSVAAIFGPRPDRRAEVPQMGGVVVKSPAAR